MLLAGGQGSRLGVLTKNKAKPALPFGGKCRIIDFCMANCINSGVDTVGVLTQYQPSQLNHHISKGMPWDLDYIKRSISILSPHIENGGEGCGYSGTANAIYQNIDFIDAYNPSYVLIIAADHIYKMDYADMLSCHKKNKCDITIAVIEVPNEEASRFGIMKTDALDRIYAFEEKPQKPKGNLASMGIYIFSWDVLRAALIEADQHHDDLDFGKHIIPMFLKEQKALYAYRFKGYWRDVGTINSYWSANLDFIKAVPEPNLYENFAMVDASLGNQSLELTVTETDRKAHLLSEEGEALGSVCNSILASDVIVEDSAVIRDSIIMAGCKIGKNTIIDRCIIAENCTIGKNVKMGIGENVPNMHNPSIYDTGITVIGEGSVIPDGVAIGKNCVVHGITSVSHYNNFCLDSGETIDVDNEEILIDSNTLAASTKLN